MLSIKLLLVGIGQAEASVAYLLDKRLTTLHQLTWTYFQGGRREIRSSPEEGSMAQDHEHQEKDQLSTTWTEDRMQKVLPKGVWRKESIARQNKTR